MNRVVNLCECAGAAVLNDAGTGCLCESPNVGTPDSCKIPSVENCGEGELIPPKFYNSSTDECDGYLHPCHETATRKDDNSGCECPPDRPFSHAPDAGSWHSRTYCVNSNGHRVSRCRSWYETRVEWYESIPDSAECLAGHSSLAHNGLNGLVGLQFIPTIRLWSRILSPNTNNIRIEIILCIWRCIIILSIAAIVLIENGANVNLKDQRRKYAPLHFAAGRTDTAENAEMIALLLVGGADPNIRNRNNWTPLDLAYHGGQIRIDKRQIRLKSTHRSGDGSIGCRWRWVGES